MENRTQKNLTRALFVVYALALVWIILFKFQLSFEFLDRTRAINLIPFKGSVTRNGGIAYYEIIGNVLAFVPLGIYVCMLKPGWSWMIKLLPALCVSVAFEVLQLTFAIGRTDITDVLANTLGGTLGVGIYWALHKMLKDKAHKAVNIAAVVLTAGMLMLMAVLFAVNR